MPDDTPKPSEVDATPDAAERTKPDSPPPGTAPRLSEADAQPDAGEKHQRSGS